MTKPNPQAKLPVSNWHQQNTKITMVEKLIVLLQWLCSKVWENEFSILWQQCICHHIRSLEYIEAHKNGADCSFWLRISVNHVCVSHITCILHDPAIHLPSVLNSNTIWWRYNLWSYTLCSFLQYPSTYGHNSLRTDQVCSQTQSTGFSQCHIASVTPTYMKMLCKDTHMFIF